MFRQCFYALKMEAARFSPTAEFLVDFVALQLGQSYISSVRVMTDAL
jgi:hypothetical protein